MKKTTLIAILMAMLPTMMFANTGGSTTYYAALKAQVSSNSSGWGKVYAGKNNSAGTYVAPSSTSETQSSTTQNEEKTFYAFAQASEGYEFSHWSTSDNGTSASTANPYSVKVKCSSSTESSPTTTTVYANFKEKTLAAFSITFETSENGSYTVDGAAPANKTGLTKATQVVLASPDEAFLNWMINGVAVNGNPYTATCTENTTISASFLTADQVTSVTTISDLTSALANNAYKKIIVPSGTTLTVAKGTTVTVPAGKQLVVDGTLAICGTVSNSGAISGSGTLYKVSYLIDQGELQILHQADGTECRTISGTAHHAGESTHYYKTTVTVNTPSVTGTVSMISKWCVLLDGQNVYEISAQSVKGVRVTIDKTIAANKITSITGSLTSTDIQSGETGNSSNWVLFSNCNLKGPARSGETNRLNFNGTIDLCGYTLTFGLARTYSDFYGVFLNGKINFTPSTDFQNGGSIFFNCSSVNITKIKGTPTMLFYDCGTAEAPAALSFSYQSGAHRNAHIYCGYYSYTFNSSYDTGYAKVYGGSFTTNPSSYLADVDTLEVNYDGKKYYIVQEKKESVYVAQIGSTQYETLDAAVNAAAAGDTISLIDRVELTDTLTIPQGKSITIALDKHTITGGKIANRGTLVFTDETTGMGKANTDASGGTVESAIDNYGSLDFVFGTYSGAIANKTDGVLTTHNGKFTDTLVREAGAVNLKGGHFAADITELATVEGCKVFHVNGLYSVCEVPDGTMTATTISGNAGYSVTPYSTADFSLLNTWYGNTNLRTSYSSANWSRLAELLSFYQLFNNSGLDATLVFDRDVAANTVQFYTISGFNRAIDKAVSAGALYRGLTAVMSAYNSASKTYAALWQDNIKSVSLAVKDNSGANAGTVCAEMIELWESTKVGSARVTNTVYIAGQKLFTFGAGSNKAMIRPASGAATFYATLGAAMDAAVDGGTVMLANDCSTVLPLTKAGTYTFDTMGFAFTGGEPTIGEGLFIKSSTTVDSAAKVLVPDAVATTYVVQLCIAQVGGMSYGSFAEAAAVALEAGNGAVVTLVAAPEAGDTVSLAKGQSLSVRKNGVAFDDAAVTTSTDGCVIYRLTQDGVTTYTSAPKTTIYTID